MVPTRLVARVSKDTFVRAGRSLHRVLPFVMGLGLVTVSAGAAPIPVNNPSFETLPAAGLTSGCGSSCSYSQDFIPGWLNTPFAGLGLSSGQFRPGADAGNSTYFDAVSDGPTSAYTSIGCIEQTVAATVQVGVTYTLQADVGWRKDASPTGLPRLRVNGLYYDGAGTTTLGQWATYTATYVGRPEDAGQPITICLTSVSFQGNFDNVRLSDSNPTTGVEAVPDAQRPRMQVSSNPFGALTRVSFSIARPSPVTLRVYDAAGRMVRTLLSDVAFETGTHQVTWDGLDESGVALHSGLFFVRLETRQGSQSGRIVRVR